MLTQPRDIGQTRRAVLRTCFTTIGVLAGLPVLAACGAATSATVSTGSAVSAAPSVSSAQSATSAAATASTVTASAATTSAATASAAPASSAAGGGSQADVYFVSRDNPKPPELAALIKPWQDAHPTLKLQTILGVNDAKLATLVAAGQQMDAVAWYQTVRTVNLGMNLLAPLDSYVARDHWNTQQYSQAILASVCSDNGKLYSLPYAYGGDAPFGMVYNRTLFQEAGLAEPPGTWDKAWSWDDFATAAGKLTKRSGDKQTQAGLANYGHYVNTVPLVWKPARWLQDDYKTITCDSPDMINAYQKYMDLVLKDKASTSSPGYTAGKGDPFYGGVAAMTAPCCSALSYATSMPPAIDWGLAPMPKGTVTSPDVQAVYCGLGTLGKQPEAGWSFLMSILEKSRFADAVQRQPSIPADVSTWVDANFKQWPNSNAKNIIVAGTSIALAIDPIRFHPKYNEMDSTIIHPAWDSMLKGTETAQQALTRIKGPLQTLANG
jgi:multiple sugar transport system substrate-binding protein